MKLALCSPLPLWNTRAAQLAAALLPGLRARGTLCALVENPYRVEPGLVPPNDLHPLAELPELVATGRVDVPIYVVADTVHHVHQLRYLRQFPGLLVLLDADLGQVAGACVADIGGTQRPFLGGFDAAESLPGTLASLSQAVVVADEATAERLRSVTDSSVPIHVLPDLADGGDPSTAAAELLRWAGELKATTPRPPTDAAAVPSVAAVVISYNSKDIIAPCLQTLLDQDYPNLEIVVVDNASADGTAEFIRAEFPKVRVIDSGSNLGFSDGNNLAFASSDADYFVLLNQDAFATRNWVTELVRVAELDPHIGAVGSKMLMDRCPTIINSTGIEMNEAGWAWDRQVGEKDEDASPVPVEVFGGCGGALLLRHAALRELGGFDSKYFMYFEDTDLCWRFLLAGYRNYYAPLAVVKHDFHGDSGATPGRALRRRYMSERNRLQSFVKNTDWPTLRRMLPKIWKYDRGRLEWLDKAVRDDHNAESHAEIASVIRRVWRWNMLRLPSLLWRRRKVQRLRKVPPDQVQRLLLPGMNEGGHQGDVDHFHDRFSATARRQVLVGESDGGTLGSGWHVLENPPGAAQPYRWSKGCAWFYLQPENGDGTVALKVASPIRNHRIELWAESHLLGEREVGQLVTEVEFALPDSIARGVVLEFRLQSDSVRPIDIDLAPDIRELGIQVMEMQVR